jgi:hypothetical protein
MADTTLPGLLATGDHASRPAASAVGSGALYSCTTHSLLYQSDGSAWSTWATLGGGTVAAADVSITDSGAYFTGTDVEAALQELGAGGGGGGGGLTQAYEGYNTIGGTADNVATHRQFLQKVTLANDCLIASIDVYLKGTSAGSAFGVMGHIYDDVAGKPQHLLSIGGVANTTQSLNLYRVAATAGDARWFSTPQGIWLPAGDYWYGATQTIQSVCNFYYDATGTGYYWDKGGNGFITDAPDTSGTVYTLTSQSRTYSFRLNTIR